MTDKQLFKLALDALECANSPNGDYENEIAALKERLADHHMREVQRLGQEIEQEPVAWLDPWTRNNVTTDYDAYGNNGIPLYTTPPQRTEPVSDDIASILACRDMLDAQPVPPRSTEQEPKHHRHTWGKDGEGCVVCGDKDWMGTSCKPPAAQRTWVGLTDEERIIMSRYDLEYAALIGEVERKLKEKNT